MHALVTLFHALLTPIHAHLTLNCAFSTLFAALLRLDKPLPFPTPLHRQPDLGQGAHMLLLNNIWNTNYPFWFPFEEEDSNLQFRFKLVLDQLP